MMVITDHHFHDGDHRSSISRWWSQIIIFMMVITDNNFHDGDHRRLQKTCWDSVECLRASRCCCQERRARIPNLMRTMITIMTQWCWFEHHMMVNYDKYLSWFLPMITFIWSRAAQGSPGVGFAQWSRSSQMPGIAYSSIVIVIIRSIILIISHHNGFDLWQTRSYIDYITENMFNCSPPSAAAQEKPTPFCVTCNIFRCASIS